MSSGKPSDAQNRPNPTREPARKWVVAVVVLSVLCATLLIATLWKRGHNGNVANVGDGTGSPAAAASLATGSQALHPTTRSSFARRPRNPEADTPAFRPRPEPSPQTRQLVRNLAELGAQPGALTPEKADAWKRDWAQLLGEGKAAVPAIAEFFQKNQDVKYDPAVTNLLGEPTLRIALLKLLFDVPAPDNVDLQKEVLQTTTDPDEIVLLAHQLDLQEPGLYQEEIVEAAKFALRTARVGQDTSALSEILKKHEEQPPPK